MALRAVRGATANADVLRWPQAIFLFSLRTSAASALNRLRRLRQIRHDTHSGHQGLKCRRWAISGQELVADWLPRSGVKCDR